MRIGNFTSSEIGALMSNGKKAGSLGAPAITYIQEKNFERKLGRALENETNARATTWGTLCEAIVFKALGLEYSCISKNSILHPEYNFWSGSPDSVCHEEEGCTVVDIKCPFTLKSFCQLVDAWALGGIQALREYHKDGDKFYWQLVSNAILTGCNTAELIVFAPYKNDLQQIRELAQRDDYMPFYYAAESELPWLYEGGYYSSVNKMRFAIPAEDKAALTARVVEAAEQLVIPVLITDLT